MSRIKQGKAKLRVCASCEWIFKDARHEQTGGCPKCGFAHYGARFVYGDAAYRYAATQKPWFDRLMEKRASELRKEIAASAERQLTRPSTLTNMQRI